MRSLLDAPSPPVITPSRAGGEALVSPVWFRAHEGELQVVVAITDRKLEPLRRDPRCVILGFQTARPFRGLRLRGNATLTPDEGATTRLAIASRHLGAEDGPQDAALERRPPVSSSASRCATRGPGTCGRRCA